MTTNIIIAGVGGQGLVLATRIISEVAIRAGYDAKTSDVIGLSQRGGKVWGIVKFGDKVHSPVVGLKEGDILVALEPLEALRWVDHLKDNAKVVINTQQIFPNRVLLEKEDYPQNIEDKIEERGFTIDKVDALNIAEEIGNLKLINTIILGRLARLLPFGIDVWIEVLKEMVPPNTTVSNLLAFQRGMKK
ncbi:indolepyruvate oxidoreductase subunit beta [Alkalicella caledoniensis]|uniref:Indolepyruvate oxidoreductase subunit beta n=1 Tax=Alkalicella caledoniensis TaxID=2731377 RepID=A0A7G9WA29_ALKCA|nr:indolepyruvate oxidoreductase subunit beta [Alkalicella caledoniensis]QNO15541.1 indolepyruvate oxidoreductase subunit beta [Alkalicella caledoniensis]